MFLFCVFAANFPHIAADSVYCPRHLDYEAEAISDSAHVCDGFPDMLLAGKAATSSDCVMIAVATAVPLP